VRGDAVSGRPLRVTAGLARSARPPDAASPSADPDAVRLAAALEGARAGHAGAFEAVYRALTPRLTWYARTLAGQDADDVVAEAWVQIIRDLPRFDGDWDGFRGWSARIVRNRAIDHLRKSARRERRDQPLITAGEWAAPEDTADAAAESMSTAAALELVATLPPDQAEAVLLRTVMGLDAKSAGQVLGKRAGAVRTSTHRGLKALARRLDDSSTPTTPTGELT
jgi:RNA polymerase sigma-70 factor (ECF subfamily)